MPRSITSQERPTTAIYPGSFDPLTNGHLDLISRGARIFDHLIVAVLVNSQKRALFSVAERLAMMHEVFAPFANVEVDSFEGLLVDYAAKRNAQAILRGIRAISDYESELQMAHLNRRLRPQTETVFLLASEEYSFISSRMIKEVAMLQGAVAQFVPEPVLAALQMKVESGVEPADETTG